VKLTAHDIHHVLQARPGYSDFGHSHSYTEGLVLFYLNHPIQLVQVVGVVVALDEYNEIFWLFTVDDGSGETIEVTCPKPAKTQEQVVDGDRATAKDKPAGDEDEINRLAVLAKIDIGSVVQAKGSIGTFRGVRKMQLKRLAIVPNTHAEMLLIEARTKTLATTLSKPWVVSPANQKSLLEDAQGDVRVEKTRAIRLRDRERRRGEREMRHAQKIAKEYEHEERERQKAAEKAREAGRSLQMSRSRAQ
jgi:Telomere regulation protein Stn1